MPHLGMVNARNVLMTDTCDSTVRKRLANGRLDTGGRGDIRSLQLPCKGDGRVRSRHHLDRRTQRRERLARGQAGDVGCQAAPGRAFVGDNEVSGGLYAVEDRLLIE